MQLQRKSGATAAPGGLTTSLARGVRSAISTTMDRRSFLKRSGIGIGAGAALGAVSFDMMGKAEAQQAPAPVGVEPLTERERSVLAYLPTLSSNQEIAGALDISVNTVKQHLKSINRKLGVNSRRDAVRVAGRLDLLPRGA